MSTPVTTPVTSPIKPDNASWINPYVMVENVDASVDFYQRAFGFEIQEKVPTEEGDTFHADMTYRGQLIMLGKVNACPDSKEQTPLQTQVASPIFLYFYVDQVDEFYQQALAVGAKSILAPEEMFWGDRMCRLQDINGYVWSFATLSQKK